MEKNIGERELSRTSTNDYDNILSEHSETGHRLFKY